MDKIFLADILPKRQRVEYTLARQPVDRVALLDQLSYNPQVIARYIGRPVDGFDYTVEDIAAVIRQTLDMAMPAVSPLGTGLVTRPDGFIMQNDNWTSWHVSRPFADAVGAAAWLHKKLQDLQAAPFDPVAARNAWRNGYMAQQRLVGDTVILNYSHTGFCGVYDAMGLEIFTFFYEDNPELYEEYLAAAIAAEIRRVHAVADHTLAPVILIAEDFAAKHGPLFSPEFLGRHHYPHLTSLAAAWHEHGITVLYHSDGNYLTALPQLSAAGMDGYYCLEKNAGMDIVALKNQFPHLVWAGGLDGVDLMERGTTEQVRAEVHRHIRQTDALATGGLFMASSSEINPPIPEANFTAMVRATGEMTNPRMVIHAQHTTAQTRVLG